MLREALQRSSAAAPVMGYIIAVPRGAKRPLLLRSLRIGSDTADTVTASIAAVILLDLEDGPQPSADLLKQVFGLTPAETRVAQRLSRGEDLGTISRALGVSVGTLRMQLKAIFWKTATRRQAELAALLAHLARMGSS